MSAEDAVEQAVDSFTQDEKFVNLHESVTGATVDRPDVPADEFDTAKFEQQYGLPANYLAGVTNLSEANAGLREFFGGDVAAAHDSAMNDIKVSSTIDELQKRINDHYDGWASPKYGTSAEPLTQAQQAERQKLGRVVSAHVAAHAKSGADVIPTITQLMNLGRVHIDSDWKPSFVKPKEYGNIHHALMNNRD